MDGMEPSSLRRSSENIKLGGEMMAGRDSGKLVLILLDDLHAQNKTRLVVRSSDLPKDPACDSIIVGACWKLLHNINVTRPTDCRVIRWILR